VVAEKPRIKNLVLLRPDIDAMTELKPLSYDEHQAADAAFRGYRDDPEIERTQSSSFTRSSA